MGNAVPTIEGNYLSLKTLSGGPQTQKIKRPFCPPERLKSFPLILPLQKIY